MISNDIRLGISVDAIVYQTAETYRINGSQNYLATQDRIRNIFEANQILIQSSCPDGYVNSFKSTNIVVDPPEFLENSNYFLKLLSRKIKIMFFIIKIKVPVSNFIPNPVLGTYYRTCDSLSILV